MSMLIDSYRFGGSPPPAGSTWDAAAKGASVALSSSDMVATKSGGGFQSVYGTNGKSSGKWQYEIKFLAGTTNSRPFAALADKTNLANLLSTYTGNNGATVAESIGLWGHGVVYWNLTAGASEAPGPSTSTNDIITITVDLDAGTPEVRFYHNGALAHTRSLAAGKTWYPAASMMGGGSVQLIPGSLTYPQSGFTDWG